MARHTLLVVLIGLILAGGMSLMRGSEPASAQSCGITLFGINSCGGQLTMPSCPQSTYSYGGCQVTTQPPYSGCGSTVNSFCLTPSNPCDGTFRLNSSGTMCPTTNPCSGTNAYTPSCGCSSGMSYNSGSPVGFTGIVTSSGCGSTLVPVCPAGSSPTSSGQCQVLVSTPSTAVSCLAPYAAVSGVGCEQRCGDGSVVYQPATCPQAQVSQPAARAAQPQASAPASAPAVTPPPVSSTYCFPPPTTSGGSSCPFLIQAVSGNDIQRIQGRESLPPVSIDRDLSGATVTVTLTNNTVDGLDLSHTIIVRTAPRLTPINVRASSGNVTAQGRAVTQDSFSLSSAATSTVSFDLQPDPGQSLPSGPLDAIGTVDLNAVDAQVGSLVTELGGKGMAITYKAGWNLVGGPTGTLLTLPPDILYAFGIGDTNYRTLSVRQALQGGSGYLNRLDADRVEFVRVVDPQTINVSLPPGQPILIGNPGTTPATVNGADQVMTLDPTSGQYQPATTLMPGQGAWAESDNGSLVTIANTPS